MSGGPLAGRRIVVTRPREQAARLAGLIRREGGEPVIVPAIEIKDLADPKPFFELADRLDGFDLAIFISPNAVHKALGLLQLRRQAKSWPARLRVAALGPGSRRALEQSGFHEVLAPASHADSEALLALPALAELAGRHVVIFRGEGGRELLGDTLATRGARVEYAACYRRARPDPGPGAPLADWARGEVDAVTVSSGEGLLNLYEMLALPERQWLTNRPLFVPHARVAEDAARLGVREIVVAGTGDEEIVARLVAYFRDAK